MKEVRLYQSLDEGSVQCRTCAHYCVLLENQFGVCGVRQNIKGRLFSHVYGKLIASHVDPIEKKPLFHFLPGSRAFSVATVGCNMHCHNCQNADISQMPKEQGLIQGQAYSPEDLIRAALQSQSQVMAYTYTEPAAYWDYAFDTARLAKQNGLKNIFVTNGYLSEDSLKEIVPFLDGANVDLKFFDDTTYRKICGAKLQPVLDAISGMRDLGIWVEVTTLLIPGLNDDEATLSGIAQYIKKVDASMPWHISRFHPTYKMLDRPITSAQSLQKAREIGLEAGLEFVYTGNLPGDEGENTFCPICGTQLIERVGFTVRKNKLNHHSCPNCGSVLAGIWE